MSMCYRLLKIFLRILNCQKVLLSSNTGLHLLQSTGYKPTSPNQCLKHQVNSSRDHYQCNTGQHMLGITTINTNTYTTSTCYCSITKSTRRALIINANQVNIQRDRIQKSILHDIPNFSSPLCHQGLIGSSQNSKQVSKLIIDDKTTKEEDK